MNFIEDIAAAQAAAARAVPVHIRWMIRRDMPEVLAIERAGPEPAWSEDGFLTVLRQRNAIGMVAELPSELVAGFVVYELHRGRIQLLKLAVEPGYRRRGVGRRLAAKLVGKLSAIRRDRVVMHVRETGLDGHLFLRAVGFRGTRVIRDYFDGPAEDAYEMVRTIDDGKEDVPR